jgi:hypothetical protein
MVRSTVDNLVELTAVTRVD